MAEIGLNKRIVLSNLHPSCTVKDLESICAPFGKVCGGVIQKNVGSIEFEDEESVPIAVEALNNSKYKRKLIQVRSAGEKDLAIRLARDRYNIKKKLIDCQIVIDDCQHAQYAEYIEKRLTDIELNVGVTYMKLNISLQKLFTALTDNECLFVLCIREGNERNNTISLYMLYGQKRLHSNIPLETAITMICNEFCLKFKRSRRQSKVSNFTKFAPTIVSTNMPELQRHSEDIQAIIDSLAANKTLTVLQYDHVIQYLRERRDLNKNALQSIILAIASKKFEIDENTDPFHHKKIDPHRKYHIAAIRATDTINKKKRRKRMQTEASNSSVAQSAPSTSKRQKIFIKYSHKLPEPIPVVTPVTDIRAQNLIPRRSALKQNLTTTQSSQPKKHVRISEINS